MCSGGKSILSLSTRGLLMTFLALQGTNSSPTGQVLLSVMLSSVSIIPHAQKALVLGEARLLSQQKIHHLQVNTNKPLIADHNKVFSSTYFTTSYFSFSVVEWARGTEANWLPLWSRTHFSNRLLLSINSLQSLGSYCGTPSLCRSWAISVQYTKSFSSKKKIEELLMSVVVKGDASTVREEVLFLQSGCQ